MRHQRNLDKLKLYSFYIICFFLLYLVFPSFDVENFSAWWSLFNKPFTSLASVGICSVLLFFNVLTHWFQISFVIIFSSRPNLMFHLIFPGCNNPWYWQISLLSLFKINMKLTFFLLNFFHFCDINWYSPRNRKKCVALNKEK